MVTLKHIADELGISINTASRALNAKPDVSPATRERVVETARRMSYVPNGLARSLIKGRTRTVGLVIDDVSNPIFGMLIRGAEDTARSQGYSVILSNTDGSGDLESQAVRILRSKRVDGMLIHPMQVSYDHLMELKAAGIPLVLLNRHIDALDVDYVINNNLSGAYQAVTHLLSLGHRRIAHVTGPLQISSVQERLAGYRKGLEEVGLPFDRDLVVHGRLDMEEGYRATEALLGQHPEITAFFLYSDLLAIGALKALRCRGYRVPEDVSLVGYDDIVFAELLEVPLTTVRQPIYEIGRRGMEVLLELVQEPEAERIRQHVVLEPQLVVRRSTCSPRVHAEVSRH